MRPAALRASCIGSLLNCVFGRSGPLGSHADLACLSVCSRPEMPRMHTAQSTLLVGPFLWFLQPIVKAGRGSRSFTVHSRKGSCHHCGDELTQLTLVGPILHIGGKFCKRAGTHEVGTTVGPSCCFIGHCVAFGGSRLS